MLWAQLRRKVSLEHERSEDVLTSNVFGTLRYLELHVGLIPALSGSSGEHAGAMREVLRNADSAGYCFWKWLPGPGSCGCEPDVLLELRRAGKIIGLILIEAKYRAGKSSVADPAAVPGSSPRDQLAREWVCVEHHAQRNNVPAFLVFLTADNSVPTRALDEATVDLERCGCAPGNFLWLSWTQLASSLVSDHPMISDLRALLERGYGFRTFDGFSKTWPRLMWSLSAAPSRARHANLQSWNMHALTWRLEQ